METFWSIIGPLQYMTGRNVQMETEKTFFITSLYIACLPAAFGNIIIQIFDDKII